MKLRIKSNSEISQKEQNDILDFIDFCWGESSRDLRARRYYAKTFKHLFLYEDHKVISYLRIIKRATTFNKNNIIIGGIGDMVTHPDYTGKDYASQLLHKAREILLEEGCDIGLINADPEKGILLYGPIGFIKLGRPYTFNDINGKSEAVEAKYVMAVPLKSPSLIDKIKKSDETLHIGNGDW